MQSLYDMIFGQANTPNSFTSPAAQQAVNQAFTQGYSAYQQAQSAGQFGSNAGLANQMAQQQYNLALGQYAQSQQKPEWMIAGVGMSFEKFVDTLCPDPEDPMRTLLILKYSGIKK